MKVRRQETCDVGCTRRMKMMKNTSGKVDNSKVVNWAELCSKWGEWTLFKLLKILRPAALRCDMVFDD